MPSQIFVPNTEHDGNNLDFNWSNQTPKAFLMNILIVPYFEEKMNIPD